MNGPARVPIKLYSHRWWTTLLQTSPGTGGKVPRHRKGLVQASSPARIPPEATERAMQVAAWGKGAGGTGRVDRTTSRATEAPWAGLSQPAPQVRCLVMKKPCSAFEK